MIFFQQYGAQRTGTNYSKELFNKNYKNLHIIEFINSKHHVPMEGPHTLTPGIQVYLEENYSTEKQHEIRKSSIVWLDEAWIFNLIKPPIWIANKNAGWNFNYFAFERFQFTIYKENGYYDWHQDIVNDASDERKISASLFLNDSDDYEEGEFQFKYQDGRNKGDTKITTLDRSLCKKGSLLVFPSYLFHRVKPVKK